MSYAVRNTIILLVTLFLIAGATIGYTKYYQQGRIDELTERLETQNADLRSKQQINAELPALMQTYEEAKEIVLGYDKTLFKTNSSYGVYEYLADLTAGGMEVYYDFVFADTAAQDNYGIINTGIQGIGTYSDLVALINKLEYGRLINKVESLSLSPASGEDNIDYVSFSFQLKSYYQRFDFEEEGAPVAVAGPVPYERVWYNPFKPVILASLPPNEEALTEVERSRILGMTGTRIFIIDQDGKSKTLAVGDRVYLGYLKSVNAAKGEAEFVLDKGGIQEIYTLTIER